MLASPFTETILLDADSVLFQDPKIVFEYEAYKQTGTYFFHDRLLWRHAYRERHDWWEKEVRISLGPTGSNQNNTENWAMGVTTGNAPMLKPVNTKAILKSKPYMEDWAEEMDSGMVVYDKSRLVLLMGLLHICWQNTPRVRDITYARTYGDKESWWFGLELCQVEYAFEPHYGSIVGEKQGDGKVCSFTIAHPDTGDKEGKKMLWYNGSLLRNKATNKTVYTVPKFRMNGDAQWLKGATKPDMSCLTGGEVQPLLVEQIEVIRKSVEEAKKVDGRFRGLIGL
jgi:alpha 1,3-mannosyltransferase